MRNMKGVFEYVTLEELTTPKQGYTCIVNCYWLTKDGKPLIYITSMTQYPQCNYQEAMAKLMLKRYEGRDWADGILFIPVAYINPNKRIV